jgi:hypothetical protein
MWRCAHCQAHGQWYAGRKASGPDSDAPADNPFLAQMRTYSLMALMQVLESDETLEPYIIRLLGACSVAGEYLADILANRQYPVVLRKQAAYFIGKVGYVDAAPVLERVAGRLESRVNGQSIMFDTGAGESDESSLLGTIQEALERLKAP